MLPLPYRLPGNRIPDILKNGNRTQGKLVSIIVINVSSPERVSRFTVIVPYRLSKKAVKRNRARRLIREALRHNLNKVTNGYDIIVMAHILLTNEPIGRIETDIVSVLDHAHLLKT
ncbi:ribonuclease P protein component [Candidatus Roizmanbacteria bacterium RIFCSPLOWO2_01_FULL_45_11]|uniref:Ribonuclease P protein component n=1 Tax=Candidatus Roizmanbacteria bacterium RIFCSPLOWO2_01_FULL_45_11 TaxID=1802070 RepID=A0A1F7JGF6_9BACT|nr:MAG: ribonuclease P protein component [Candidatus Roizmanbacteria bacterium RIFCSPLOWO2_01_FULL_45_11]